MGTIFSILFGAIIGGFAVAKIAGFLFENSKNFYEYKAEKDREFHNVSIQYHVAEAKNLIYEDMIVAQGRKEQQALDLVYRVLGAAIDKVQTPIPYYPQLQQTSQNSTNTAVHVQETPLSIDRGGAEHETIGLNFRGGVKKGDVQHTADGMLNCQGYKLMIPKIGADVVQFGNTGVYTGGCKNCNNRFVTTKSNTNTCSVECHEQHKR